MTENDFQEFVFSTLSEVKDDLRDHMRRTEISEERHNRQDEINVALVEELKEMAAKLVPLEKAHQVWVFIGRFAAILSPIVGALLVAWLKSKFS